MGQAGKEGLSDVRPLKREISEAEWIPSLRIRSLDGSFLFFAVEIGMIWSEIEKIFVNGTRKERKNIIHRVETYANIESMMYVQ